MEQFSLEKYLENPNRKVVTRDGIPVRIICWDRPGFFPIIVYTEDELNSCFSTTKLGFYCTDGAPSQNDLFFADSEEELTELQTTLEEDCDCYVKLYNEGRTREELREWIKAWYPRIIDLARKELLKDLPKWKKATEHKDLEKHIAILEDGKVLLSNYLEEGDCYIELDSLKTLPKEEE